MNKLVKYCLIVNLIALFMFILFFLSNVYLDYYDKTHTLPTQYDEYGPMPADRPSNTLGIRGTIHFFFIPLTVLLSLSILFLSGKYAFQKPTGKGYFQSLLISVSFIVFTTLLIILNEIAIDRCSGEECMYLLFLAGYLILALFIPAIIDFIIFLFRKSKITVH